jgi:hypothetical protein
MGRPTLEVADIVREFRAAYEALRGGKLPASESRVLDDIVHCRTAFFGGHLLRCNECGHEDISYNSCRNRHCPKCQAAARAEWLTEREKELLLVQYFHVVFTIPKEIAPIALLNKRLVYGILLQASAETLLEVAATPKHLGAEIAILSVLHTWGQNLQHHPHVHCVVPGGGISPDGSHWKHCRDGFFLPVKVLGALFRGKFLARLQTAYDKGVLELAHGTTELSERPRFRQWLSAFYDKDWVVYAKRPFGGPEQVLRYLANYTHRTAISNHRLVSLRDGNVSFLWKDYAHGCRRRVMTLTTPEFLRRFLMHVLPKGFVRIRHYGFLANRHRSLKLELCRKLLQSGEIVSESADDHGEQDVLLDPSPCPVCDHGVMIRMYRFEAGETPPAYRSLCPSQPP